MTYEISPSTLKNGVDDKFGCERCFWLKIRKDVRPPFPEGLGKIHTQIHDWFFEQIQVKWPDILPKGKLVLTEEWLRAEPYRGIQLFGRIDGLIELDSGGYCVIDLKTISKPESRRWAHLNYSLQVNAYRFMLENATDGFPRYSPVRLMGVVTFAPNRFAIRDEDAAGIAGSVRWHEIPIDGNYILESIDKAAHILASDDIPPLGANCTWCEFYSNWKISFG